MKIRKRDLLDIRKALRIYKLHGGSNFADATVLEYAFAGRHILVRTYVRQMKRHRNKEYLERLEQAKENN